MRAVQLVIVGVPAEVLYTNATSKLPLVGAEVKVAEVVPVFVWTKAKAIRELPFLADYLAKDSFRVT